jgi:hypothetical protein
VHHHALSQSLTRDVPGKWIRPKGRCADYVKGLSLTPVVEDRRRLDCPELPAFIVASPRVLQLNPRKYRRLKGPNPDLISVPFMSG